MQAARRRMSQLLRAKTGSKIAETLTEQYSQGNNRGFSYYEIPTKSEDL